MKGASTARICIVGTGYVGLVNGACLAKLGNDVCCIDIDAAKIEALKAGHVSLREPKLEDLVRRNQRAGRLRFTTSYAEASARAQIAFVAVDTPVDQAGQADLTSLYSAVASLVHVLEREHRIEEQRHGRVS